MNRDLLHLDYIVDSIARIEGYTAEGRELFLASILVQDAVARNLQTLCKSTQKLSAQLKATHPEIDWQGLAAVRNILTHEYMEIQMDMDAVWSIVQDDLPRLNSAARQWLSELEGS